MHKGNFNISMKLKKEKEIHKAKLMKTSLLALVHYKLLEA